LNADGPCNCSWEVYITTNIAALPDVPSIQTTGGIAGTCAWTTEGFCWKERDCSGTYTLTSTAAAGTWVWVSVPAPGNFGGVRVDNVVQAGQFECGGLEKNIRYNVHRIPNGLLLGWVNLAVSCHECAWNE